MSWEEVRIMPRKSKDVLEKEKRRKQDLEQLTPDDFFKLKPMMSNDPDVIVIQGMRSNGKTYGVLEYCIRDYKDHGRRFIYTRRLAESITKKNIAELLDPFMVNPYVKTPLIEELWGEGAKIRYNVGKFEVIKPDDPDFEKEIIGYVESLSTTGTWKSKYSDAQNIYNFILDEFLPLKSERALPEEINSFEQATSSVFRSHAENCKVFLIGNTVSVYSPYFTNFGINTFSMNQQGKIYNIELPNEVGEPTKVAFQWTPSNTKISKQTSKFMRSSKIAMGEYEIDPVAEIPHTDNERAHETLLCTFFDNVMGINLGIFLRRAVWYSFETDNYRTIQKPNVREFLVIRQTEKTSSYYHLSNVKTLQYNTWTNMDKMFKDIEDNVGININDELLHNRVFSENMFTADYFYHTYDFYRKLGMRDLL